RRSPIVHVQSLQLRRQPPGQLQRGLAEKHKPRRIIFGRLAALAINSRTIKQFVTSDKEPLDAVRTAPFEVARSVDLIAHLHIDGYACVLLFERTILSNLMIER